MIRVHEIISFQGHDHDEQNLCVRLRKSIFYFQHFGRPKLCISMKMCVVLRIFAILANVGFNLKKLPPLPPHPTTLAPPQAKYRIIQYANIGNTIGNTVGNCMKKQTFEKLHF